MKILLDSSDEDTPCHNRKKAMPLPLQASVRKLKRSAEFVNINVGIIRGNEKGQLQIIRGSKLPLQVSKQADAKTILKLATKKHGDHDQYFDSKEEYILLYPDTTKVVTVPGCENTLFTLEKYKINFGKPYSKIDLFLCTHNDLEHENIQKMKYELMKPLDDFEMDFNDDISSVDINHNNGFRNIKDKTENYFSEVDLDKFLCTSDFSKPEALSSTPVLKDISNTSSTVASIYQEQSSLEVNNTKDNSSTVNTCLHLSNFVTTAANSSSSQVNSVESHTESADTIPTSTSNTTSTQNYKSADDDQGPSNKRSHFESSFGLCPICNKRISFSGIEMHVDECLLRKEKPIIYSIIDSDNEMEEKYDDDTQVEDKTLINKDNIDFNKELPALLKHCNVVNEEVLVNIQRANAFEDFKRFFGKT